MRNELFNVRLPSFFVVLCPVSRSGAALPERLGLKLESGKGPVNVLVVDDIEQPGDN